MNKAVILVAGMGTRLRPLTDNEHKCMTKVCGTPIIEHTLRLLEKLKIDEVVLVVGYLKEQLKEQINKMNIGIPICYADNDIYNTTNTAYSLKLGLEKAGECDELFVIEGDVFFERKVFERLINSSGENATILERYNERLEGTFAEVDREGNVIDWRHKSDQDNGYVLVDKYKTVNLHKFSYQFVRTVLVPQINKYVAANGMNNPLEKVMRVIVTENNDAIKGEILNGEKWYEIDDLNDLKIAESIFGDDLI